MNKFKKLTKVFSFLLTSLCIIHFMPSKNSYAASTAPDLTSQGVCLLDGDTGQVVYEKNQDKRYYPASTTKVLTALVVLEHTNLEDKVTIGTNPPNAEGTSVGIRATETYTVRELLLGLILMSGNDCANALAEYISGSNEAFANLMNEKAAELGCTNSHFANPSGLPDENHYTTPKDLATIMKACIHNKDFMEISQTNGYTLPASSIDGKTIPIDNHNYILFDYYPNYYYKYSIASKKGYTIAAQFTNIIACKKDNTTLVGSFLKGTDISSTYNDVKSIFDYAFANFERQTLYTKDTSIEEVTLGKDKVNLKPKEDVYYTCNMTDKDNLNYSIEYEIPSDIADNTFKKDDTITTANIIVNGEVYKTIDLVSDADYNAIDKLYEEVSTNNNKSLCILAAVIIGLFIIASAKFIYNKKFLNKTKEENQNK